MSKIPPMHPKMKALQEKHNPKPPKRSIVPTDTDGFLMLGKARRHIRALKAHFSALQLPQDKLDELLKTCAKQNCIQAAQILLTKGANPTANNNSCLIWAARSNSLDVVNLFISKDYNFNVQEAEPLRWAANEGHTKVVLSLCKQSPQSIAARKYQAIEWATQRAHSEIVVILITNAANKIEAAQAFRNTPRSSLSPDDNEKITAVVEKFLFEEKIFKDIPDVQTGVLDTATLEFSSSNPGSAKKYKI